MEQEIMQLKEELKELVQKGQHVLQKMEGAMAQRMYGMRSNQSPGNAGYSGGSSGGSSSGGYGQREPWMQGGYPQQMPPPMQPQMPMQGMQQQYPMQYPQQDMMQQMNPLWFL